MWEVIITIKFLSALQIDFIKSLNFNLLFFWLIRVNVIMLMLKVGTDGSSAVESLTV
jgi:hypothetical protein